MRVDDPWLNRFIALSNIGYADGMKEELIERCRLEDLTEQLKTAEQLRNFKGIKLAQEAIRAELKRQGQGPLTDLERRVLGIHEFLHFRDGRPPTDPELHRRFCKQYPKFQHDLKTISRARARIGLQRSEGKRGPKASNFGHFSRPYTR